MSTRYCPEFVAVMPGSIICPPRHPLGQGWGFWISFCPRGPITDPAYFLKHLGSIIEHYSPEGNVIAIGDMNKVNTNISDDFLLKYNLTNLIKTPTCFKSTKNHSSLTSS